MGILETSIGQLGISLAIKISLVTTCAPCEFVMIWRTMIIVVRLMVMIIIKVALVININIIIDDSYESRSKNTCRPVQRMPARRFYFALKLCHQYPAKEKYEEEKIIPPKIEIR